jgi:VanZ family protein
MTDSIRSTRPARTAAQTFIRFWLPAVALCAAIFVQSAYPPLGQIPPWPHIDKVLHAFVYGMLGVLICRALSTIRPLSANKWRLVVYAVALTTLYGLSDEWHQSFVPGRHASAADLLADFIGALVGSAVGLAMLSRFRLFR